MADTLNTGTLGTAGHPDMVPSGVGHPDMDYAEHEATYALFLRLLKFGTIGVVCVVIFLAVMWG